ncbi:cinnamyl-alcohol dehydrogenase, partial [Sarracenia purpurea var. burkii]
PTTPFRVSANWNAGDWGFGDDDARVSANWNAGKARQGFGDWGFGDWGFGDDDARVLRSTQSRFREDERVFRKTKGAGPGMNVEVVKLGRLGHAAVKFVKAFGFKVAVISTSPRKKKDGIERLEADSFLVSHNPNQMPVTTYL